MFRPITQDDISAARQRWTSRVYEVLANPSNLSAESVARDPLWRRLIGEELRYERVFGQLGLPGRYSPGSPQVNTEPYATQASSFPVNAIISSIFQAVGYPASHYDLLAIPSPHYAGVNPGPPLERIIGMGSPTVRELEQATAPYHTFFVLPGETRTTTFYESLAGFTPEFLNELEQRTSEILSMQKPKWWLTVYAHEVGHSLTMPLVDSPSLVVEMAEKYGRNLPEHERNRLAEAFAKHAAHATMLAEAQADMFAAAVGLSPRSLLELRYAFGLKSYVELQKRRYAVDELSDRELSKHSRMRYGSPIKMRVISPSVVESEDSEIYRNLLSFNRHVLESAFQLAPGQQPQEGLQSHVVRMLESMEAYKRDLESGNLVEAQERYADMLVYASGMVNASMGYMSLMMEGARWLPQEVHPVTDHLSSRLWTISYMLAKSHPELIGQEVEIYPDKIVVKGGWLRRDRVITPEEMLPPELPVFSLGSIEHAHPLQLESAIKAQEVYKRARELVQSGFQLEGGASGEDVISVWRRVFHDQIAGAMT